MRVIGEMRGMEGRRNKRTEADQAVPWGPIHFIAILRSRPLRVLHQASRFMSVQNSSLTGILMGKGVRVPIELESLIVSLFETVK